MGGIGIAPGGNINYVTGHAIFEATHGTAPKYANLDKVNPGSVILSGEMMFRHLGWDEAADSIIKGMEGAIAAKTVTYDFHRLMEGATLTSCSGFGRRSSPTCDAAWRSWRRRVTGASTRCMSSRGRVDHIIDPALALMRRAGLGIVIEP